MSRYTAVQQLNRLCKPKKLNIDVLTAFNLFGKAMNIALIFAALVAKGCGQLSATSDFNRFWQLKSVKFYGNYGSKIETFLTIFSNSKIHCAVLCSQIGDCHSAQWEPETNNCYMYQGRNLVIWYPLADGVTTSPALIGGPLESKSLQDSL